MTRKKGITKEKVIQGMYYSEEQMINSLVELGKQINMPWTDKLKNTVAPATPFLHCATCDFLDKTNNLCIHLRLKKTCVYVDSFH
ncbi:MAG: hypothetical protein NWF09_07690 [Candidatus Bathyarchaeota archaeon]|nr:hypothetical protein [Candidatus Bathyarchaeota archaeon]